MERYANLVYNLRKKNPKLVLGFFFLKKNSKFIAEKKIKYNPLKGKNQDFFLGFFSHGRPFDIRSRRTRVGSTPS